MRRSTKIEQVLLIKNLLRRNGTVPNGMIDITYLSTYSCRYSRTVVMTAAAVLVGTTILHCSTTTKTKYVSASI